jgi:CBS domain-containing protein
VQNFRISYAFPYIFERNFAKTEQSSPLLIVASILRFQRVDAVAILGEHDSSLVDNEGKIRAIAGYSILSKLMDSEDSSWDSVYHLPCYTCAERFTPISQDVEVDSLLKQIAQSRFGFTFVRDQNDLTGFITLRDFFKLYQKSLINAPFTIGHLASPIISVESSSTIKETLKTMFSMRIRRIYVSDLQMVVTDRMILDHLFSSEATLMIEERSSSRILNASLNLIRMSKAKFMESPSSIVQACKVIEKEETECLICDEGIVTPWDIVIKPWVQRSLTFSETEP